MGSDSLVSIIIPVYNRAELLPQTLDSVLAQTYENWECIIIDDGSSDESAVVAQDYAKKDNRFRFFFRPSERPGGGNAARNYGFEKSSGEFVNWFDSDDLMRDDFIEKKIRLFFADDSLDGVISKRASFDRSPSEIKYKEVRTKLTNNLISDFAVRKITWYLQDVMWKKSFLADKELFRETLLSGQDRDFHLRMLLESPALAICNAYLTLYRDHRENITTSWRSNDRFRISHLYGMVALINLLEKRGALDQAMKNEYFRSMMKYLPNVYKEAAHMRTLKNLLIRMGKGQNNTVGWLRFYLALLSYRLTGRGYFLLADKKSA